MSDFEIQGDRLIKYHGEAETVIVPNGVRVIAEYALAYGYYTKKIVLPPSVRVLERCSIKFNNL